MKRCLLFIMILAVLLCGCNVLETPSTVPGGSDYVPGELDAEPVEVDFASSDSQMFTDADAVATYSESDSAVIELKGSGISSNANSVIIDGSTATITRGGTYILRGTLDDGSVIVDAGKDKPHLILEGASITSADFAALYIREAGKVFVTLAEGTDNTLANGGSFTAIDTNTVDAALFSKTDVSLNGAGSLTVVSPGGHGIVCKDDLAIVDGKLTIQSASHALDANDSIRIKGGSLTMNAGMDGIHAEDANDAATGFVYISGGVLNIEAEGDGVSAALHMQVSGGTIDILAGGGYENGEKQNSGNYGDFMGGGMFPGGNRPSKRAVTTTATEDTATSMKGLKAGAGLLIEGSTLTVDSADDALHSDTVSVINGGMMKLASGDDGIHAETDLNITAGQIEITQSYEGLEAKNILLTGGKISLVATDDGLNAAGGVDGSGEGGRDQMFGGMGQPGGNRPGGMGGTSDGSVVISGGELYVQASGDGIDANGSIQISGGYTVICGPNNGDTATLDYDISASITGGVFIGTGALGMAQTFSANTQGVLAIRANNQSSGVKITVSDSSGKELLSYEPELAFSVIIYSAPELVSGQSYHVTVGSQEAELNAS
ncbi:MAG: carbohydrate-binding domain-containing protein [Oscillospiraceae bacterium]|nr:carbohydrate-binding domain-containing protein [Oscillospiraceae bacterium]